MRKMVAVLVLAALSGSQIGAQAPNNQPTATVLTELPLADQFDRAFNPAVHRGHVLVMIYGDRASTEANKALGEWLHVTFHPTAKGLPPAQARQQPVRPIEGIAPGTVSPDVLAVPVACCGKVPNLVQGLIRGQIKSGSPDVPVLLDFQEVMKSRFGQVERVPNLIIVDRAGAVRYMANGPFSAEQMQQLAGIIEGLRREGPAANR